MAATCGNALAHLDQLVCRKLELGDVWHMVVSDGKFRRGLDGGHVLDDAFEVGDIEKRRERADADGAVGGGVFGQFARLGRRHRPYVHPHRRTTGDVLFGKL